MSRRPHPRSRHSDEPNPPRSSSRQRTAARSGAAATGGRRIHRSGGARRNGDGPKGSHTFLWLALILALLVGAGWAVLQTQGDDDAGPATPPSDPGLADAGPKQRLVIPEGLRREDIAALLERETDLSGERYLQLTAAGPRGRKLAAADEPRSFEGFLFPATYDLFEETTVANLVDQQIAAFEANTANIDFRPAKRRNLTPYEVLTIASMVEREVVVASERRRVAGVIYNRLREGMTLGIDATVQYAIGEWKEELTVSDLDIDSPYNTRKFLGLPPGPIANPGKDSIQASALPEEHDYLFYVAKFDGTGEHYFSTNAADFERDVQRSRANAGRSQ